MYVIQNWGKISAADMAAHIDRSPTAIPYLANAIRNVGYPLPKLTNKAMLKNIIAEALDELGLSAKKGA